jgi:hypothetical protein
MGEEIPEGSQIKPTFRSPEIGNISHASLVGLLWGKVTI